MIQLGEALKGDRIQDHDVRFYQLEEGEWYMEFNPIIKSDYPDVDVIRVGDVYYMITTTMYFMPGGEILRSYDLVHWEHLTYVYDILENTPAESLLDGQNAYGKGMWAASLRFFEGRFYVCFVANDTHRTYLYTSDDIMGPWRKQEIEGFYHDCSLYFEGDRRFIVYGNTNIYLTELNQEMTGPKEGGLHRLLVTEKDPYVLGYEGAHFYKIDGRYYLFLIHSPGKQFRRLEACFACDSLEGEFVGGDVFDEDLGFRGAGVAQGGIVDTPDGKWYAMLFQDHGAVGRAPVLLPVKLESGQFVFGDNGRMPLEFELPVARVEHTYLPLTQSDDFATTGDDAQKFGTFGLKSVWQFNHNPELSCVKLITEEKKLVLHTVNVCDNLEAARNTLTQRMVFPYSSATVSVDGSSLKEGDYAGIGTHISRYGMIALTRRDGRLVLVSHRMEEDGLQEVFVRPLDEIAAHDGDKITLRVEVHTTEREDWVEFYYQENEWKKAGERQQIVFRLDHFTGCRFALFAYATKQTSGSAAFTDFVYEK